MIQLYYTLSSKDHNCFSQRQILPAALLPAASFVHKNAKGKYYLRPPKYPLLARERGADCGAFTATIRWGGQYRFSLRQYVVWLSSWKDPPHWAATMDLCCITPKGEYPGKEEVRRRQHWSTEQAWECWQLYRAVPWAWCPTITGYYIEEYEQHAKDLRQLIEEMWLYYSDPGTEEEINDSIGYAFRVGVGSLCGRANPVFLAELIGMLHTLLPVPLHLWGVKLGTLEARIELPGVVSCDTSVWNNLFGKEHELRRESGKTVTEYGWDISLPTYQQKVAIALMQPTQSTLFSHLPTPVALPPPELSEEFYQLYYEANG